MQKYTDIICATQQQTNLSTSLLQDIPTFDGLDTTELEGLAHWYWDGSWHQEHHATLTGHTADHIMTTTLGTDSSPFITDTAKEYALTDQNHITNLLWQKCQQLLEACILLPITPPQQLVLPIHQMML